MEQGWRTITTTPGDQTGQGGNSAGPMQRDSRRAPPGRWRRAWAWWSRPPARAPAAAAPPLPSAAPRIACHARTDTNRLIPVSRCTRIASHRKRPRWRVRRRWKVHAARTHARTQPASANTQHARAVRRASTNDEASSLFADGAQGSHLVQVGHAPDLERVRRLGHLKKRRETGRQTTRMSLWSPGPGRHEDCSSTRTHHTTSNGKSRRPQHSLRGCGSKGHTNSPSTPTLR